MNRSAAPASVAERLALLSEPVRLRLLRLLESHELSVGELASVVQLPQSTVSRHLKLLADARWLSRHNEGTAAYYRLVMDDLPGESRALWLTVREQLGGAGDLAEDARRVQGVLAERKTDSQTFFGRVAGGWDSLRGQLFGDRFAGHALLSLLPADWVVADLGCGTGNLAETLAPVAQRVYALDQSEAMLGAARRRLAGVKNVEFVRSPLDPLTLEDGSVDACVCSLVLHHVPEPIGALREMRRVLRASRGGGRCLVIDMVEHDRARFRQTMGHVHLGFSRKTIAALFSEAGFASMSYRELPIEPDAKGPGLFVATGTLS